MFHGLEIGLTAWYIIMGEKIMKPTRLFFFIVTVLFAAFSAGCELPEESLGEDSEPPPLPTVVFRSPQTTSTNPEALNTKVAVDAMNGFSSYFLIFSGLTPTRDQNAFLWTYTSQGLTITLTATKLTDGGYSWKIVYNGTDSENKTYNNWTSLDGTTTVDSKSGAWVVYQENATTKTADFQWSTSATDALSGTFQLYNNGAPSTQLTLTSNADNSGELKQYDVAALIYRSLWQANGSGQWWRYDTNGQLTGSGTW